MLSQGGNKIEIPRKKQEKMAKNIELALMLGLDLKKWNSRPESDFLYTPSSAKKGAGDKGDENKKNAIGPLDFLEKLEEEADILKKIKYFSVTNTFYVYDRREGFWVGMASRVFEVSLQQIVSVTKHLQGFILPSAFTRILVNELKGTEIHNMYVPDFDMNYICLKNCLVNTLDGEPLPHTSGVFLTSSTQYNWSKSKQSPVEWEGFLENFCNGHEDRKQFLKAWMRVVLASSKSAQVFLYIFGPGSTGKSVFANTLNALLGSKRVVHTSLKALNTDQFETYNLVGKPLIVIADSELYEGDLNILKQITGNDVISGRAKYVQGAFEIHKTGNVMIIANVPFFSRESGNAIQRRLLLFVADKIVTNRKLLIEPQSGGFFGPLADELPQILKWVFEMSLDEANSFLINQETLVPSLKPEIAFLKELSNPMRGWAKRFLEVKRGFDTPVGAEAEPKLGTLYWSYLNFCKKYGLVAERPRNFSSYLQSQLHGLGGDWLECKLIRKNQGMFFANLALLAEPAPEGGETL